MTNGARREFSSPHHLASASKMDASSLFTGIFPGPTGSIGTGVGAPSASMPSDGGFLGPKDREIILFDVDFEFWSLRSYVTLEWNRGFRSTLPLSVGKTTMRPSTALAYLGFCNIFIGTAGFIYGLLTRVIFSDHEIGQSPFFRQTATAYPLVETFFDNATFLAFDAWIGPINLVECVFLAIAGFGLLSSRRWARRLTLVCSGVRIATATITYVLLLVLVLSTPLQHCLALTFFGIGLTYPVIAVIVLNRPVILESLRHGLRENAATPSLRALSEKHRAARATLEQSK